MLFLLLFCVVLADCVVFDGYFEPCCLEIKLLFWETPYYEMLFLDPLTLAKLPLSWILFRCSDLVRDSFVLGWLCCCSLLFSDPPWNSDLVQRVGGRHHGLETGFGRHLIWYHGQSSTEKAMHLVVLLFGQSHHLSYL